MHRVTNRMKTKMVNVWHCNEPKKTQLSSKREKKVMTREDRKGDKKVVEIFFVLTSLEGFFEGV